MWTTIFLATKKEQAISVENVLVSDGFLVKVEEDYEEKLYEILVLKFEAEDAQNALFERGII
ncbi:MAG: hypothetical protein PHY91_01000 [Tissierellia bacterium]|nr:hypothetical protein [Tissierellia bacterium]MDD4726046.1 hypothetical protein [Tissierellia bacterium]